MSSGRRSAEFLVRARVSFPPELPEQERATLLEAEYERGCELARAGVIRGIWRIPGALANVSIWRAADATELHELLTSLPLARHMTFEVTALARHPIAVATGLDGEGASGEVAGSDEHGDRGEGAGPNGQGGGDA